MGWMWNLRQVGMGDRRQKGRLARLAPLPVPVICALCRCAECLTRCLGSCERPFAIRSACLLGTCSGWTDGDQK